LGEIFNLLTTKLFCLSFYLRALPVPPMRRIKRITGAITATQIRLAIVLALAAAIFLDLAIMHRTQTSQVGERVMPARSPALDMIDVSGPGSAAGHRADISIAF
jgi:hypothetical protein